MPAPTTTSSSRSPTRSWWPACGRSSDGSAGCRTDPAASSWSARSSLDESRRSVAVDGAAVDLSPREFALLECLLRHPGHALSRDQLLDMAWPFGVAVTPNTVDAFITFLRRKLGPVGAARIQTVRGVGYRMVES